MRIALAQTNPRIGAFSSNLQSALTFLSQAQSQKADLIVFPECTLIGYPPKDLLLRKSFLTQAHEAFTEFTRHVQNITAILGTLTPNPSPIGRPLFNTLSIIQNHQVTHIFQKSLLPTYDCFDESRYFEPAPPNSPNLVIINNRRVGITICEDLWCEPSTHSLYHHDPIANLIPQKPDLVLNISASPYGLNKPTTRPAMYSRQAKRLNCPLIIVNQVGAHDDLIFDGNSCAFNSTGSLIAHCREFSQDLLLLDLSSPPARIESPSQGNESILRALRFSLRQFSRNYRFHLESPTSPILKALIQDLPPSTSPPLHLSPSTKTDLALGRGIPGHIAPLGDLTNRRVNALAAHLNIPLHLDESLDSQIEQLIEQDQSNSLSAEIDSHELTRHLGPLPLKLTPRSFGPGRPMPLLP